MPFIGKTDECLRPGLETNNADNCVTAVTWFAPKIHRQKELPRIRFHTSLTSLISNYLGQLFLTIALQSATTKACVCCTDHERGKYSAVDFRPKW